MDDHSSARYEPGALDDPAGDPGSVGADDTLSPSESRYRDLFLNAPVVYLNVSTDGTIVGANRAAEDFFGFSTDELLGMEVKKLYAKESTSPAKEIFKRFLRGESSRDEEMVYTRKDGERVRGLLSVIPITDERGEVVESRSIIIDITNRREMEDALRASEEQFRNLAEQSPNMIFINHRGRVVFANDACESMMGYSVEEFLAPDFQFMNLIAPDSVDVVRSSFEQHSKGREVPPYESGLITKSGNSLAVIITTRLISYKGEVAILGIVTDISERKKTEQALARREATLDAIFRAAPIGIGLVSNRVLQEVNDRLCEITGYAREELVGESARKLYPSDEEYEFVGREKYDQIAQEGIGSVETRLQRKDGAIRDILLSSTPLNPDDLLAGVTFTALDITGRKLLESQLIQSQKMESIGRLAGGIAHDFNNLLTSIIGYAEIVRMNLPSEDPTMNSMQHISKAADRAAELVQQLLAFSSKAMTRPKVLDLNQVVIRSRDILIRTLGEDVIFTFRPGKDLGAVKADPGHVELIIMNLAVNCRDAMPEGGDIVLETGNLDLAERHLERYPSAEKGRYVMISMSDTGHGMNEETMARIFDPFFTTRATGAGTGLGLSTVYGIVKQHGGHIEVRSEPGAGTTMEILFPMVDEPLEDAGSASEALEICRGDETLLLVEDEESVRTTVEQILIDCGYSVLTAGNMEEALEVWEERADVIDLLMTDVVMPGGSGRELAGVIQGDRPALKVLYMSGYSEEMLARDEIEQDQIQFIQKPFTPAGITTRIREVLDS